MTEWTGSNITAISALSMVVLAIFFMLAREILVTGAAHRREVAAMAQQIDALRVDHGRQMEGLRSDRDAVVARLNAEVERIWAALHIERAAYVALARSIEENTDAMQALSHPTARTRTPNGGQEATPDARRRT